MYVMRKKFGISQELLAQLIGVTQPRISAWETRRAAIPKERAAQIARILMLDPDTLIDDII